MDGGAGTDIGCLYNYPEILRRPGKRTCAAGIVKVWKLVEWPFSSDLWSILPMLRDFLDHLPTFMKVPLETPNLSTPLYIST